MTAERQETVADIVAEMHTRTEPGMWVPWAEIGRLADRIEAAHKREQDAHNAFLTGVAQGIIDEKKKHDAELRRVQVATQEGHDVQPVVVNDIPTDNSTKTQKDGVLSFGADGAAPAGQGCSGNVAKIREALAEAVRLFETAVARNRWAEELVWLDEAKAALSAPRRNYERFENGREAMNAFDHGGCPGDCAECIYDDYHEREENCEHCEVNWLFDTVAPETGGQS